MVVNFFLNYQQSFTNNLYNTLFIVHIQKFSGTNSLEYETIYFLRNAFYFKSHYM